MAASTPPLTICSKCGKTWPPLAANQSAALLRRCWPNLLIGSTNDCRLLFFCSRLPLLATESMILSAHADTLSVHLRVQRWEYDTLSACWSTRWEYQLALRVSSYSQQVLRVSYSQCAMRVSVPHAESMILSEWYSQRTLKVWYSQRMLRVWYSHVECWYSKALFIPWYDIVLL